MILWGLPAKILWFQVIVGPQAKPSHVLDHVLDWFLIFLDFQQCCHGCCTAVMSNGIRTGLLFITRVFLFTSRALPEFSSSLSSLTASFLRVHGEPPLELLGSSHGLSSVMSWSEYCQPRRNVAHSTYIIISYQEWAFIKLQVYRDLSTMAQVAIFTTSRAFAWWCRCRSEGMVE